jgi:hypothetical protein
MQVLIQDIIYISPKRHQPVRFPANPAATFCETRTSIVTTLCKMERHYVLTPFFEARFIAGLQ